MDYKEFQMLEASFQSFTTKLKSKKQIQIEYLFLKGRFIGYDFSFHGYRTKTGWHGIHYCKQKNVYYFGTRELKSNRDLQPIPPGLLNKIPDEIKDAFFRVVQIKMNVTINK